MPAVLQISRARHLLCQELSTNACRTSNIERETPYCLKGFLPMPAVSRLSRVRLLPCQRFSIHAPSLPDMYLPSSSSLLSPFPSPQNHNPKLRLTPSLTLLSNSALLSLHIFAASTFAGLSSFGSASILITLIRIFSTLCIGLHLSDAFS